MIALGTNILVRYFLAGDDRETLQAVRLIETELSADQQGYVTAVTLCEIIWVLRSRYGFGNDAQIAIVKLMLDSAQLNVEHADSAELALQTNHLDLADAIIHFIGVKRGCSKTLTFDSKFARLAGVELLR